MGRASCVTGQALEADGRSQVGRNCVASLGSLFVCGSVSLRPRTRRPQLKREPLGSRTHPDAPSASFLGHAPCGDGRRLTRRFRRAMALSALATRSGRHIRRRCGVRSRVRRVGEVHPNVVSARVLRCMCVGWWRWRPCLVVAASSCQRSICGDSDRGHGRFGISDTWGVIRPCGCLTSA